MARRKSPKVWRKQVGDWTLRVTWKGDLALCTWRRKKGSLESFVIHHAGSRRDLTRHFERAVTRRPLRHTAP